MVYQLPDNTYTSYEKKYSDVLTPTRFSYIRQLHVSFFLFGQFPLGQRRHRWSLEETAQELEKALEHFFNLLASTPHGQEPLLDLHFYANEPISNLFGTEPQPSESLHGLPELPMIRIFRFSQGMDDELFSSHTVLLVASKMPRLRGLGIKVKPRLMEIWTTHQRIELARSLADVPLPASLQNFTLRYYKAIGPDGFPAMENEEDVLTRELRRLSQRKGLKHLAFFGRVGPSIFWPPDSASEAQQWPTLKAFTLQLVHSRSFDIVSGVKKRITMFKASLNAFCQALAKCSAHMPKAEYNSIEFNDIWGTSLACIVVSGNRFIELKGKPDLALELDRETFDEWRKTADIHNLDSEMRIVECDQHLYSPYLF